MYLLHIVLQPCPRSAGSAGSDRGLASHCRSMKEVFEVCDGSFIVFLRIEPSPVVTSRRLKLIPDLALAVQ
jgi:hypothetical protein